MDFLKEKVDNLKIIVFDLDYTLWPFWVDTHVTPPFRLNQNGKVVDAFGKKVKYYKEVPQLLKNLTELGYTLGIASRTPAIDDAEELLKLFDWNQYFKYKEIFPARKTIHFEQICEKSGVQFSQMLFFDDETRNIIDLQRLGVASILVDNGVNSQIIIDGIKIFTQSNQNN